MRPATCFGKLELQVGNAAGCQAILLKSLRPPDSTSSKAAAISIQRFLPSSRRRWQVLSPGPVTYEPADPYRDRIRYSAGSHQAHAGSARTAATWLVQRSPHCERPASRAAHSINGGVWTYVRCLACSAYVADEPRRDVLDIDVSPNVRILPLSTRSRPRSRRHDDGAGWRAGRQPAWTLAGSGGGRPAHLRSQASVSRGVHPPGDHAACSATLRSDTNRRREPRSGGGDARVRFPDRKYNR